LVGEILALIEASSLVQHRQNCQVLEYRTQRYFVDRINFVLKSQHKLQFILSKYWTIWWNQQNHGIWLKKSRQTAEISASVIFYCP